MSAVRTAAHRAVQLTVSAAGRQLQIFNIETKAKVKQHLNEHDIVFWKWVNETTIGMVTDTSVYHWTITDPNSPPQKIFDRHATLAGAQIINYRVTDDEKWLVLIGISGNAQNPSGFKIKGSMQLYSRERNVSQPIEGHAAAFAEIKLDGHQKPTKLFTFAVRTATGAKVRLKISLAFSEVKRRLSCTLWKSTTKDPILPIPRRTSTSSSRPRPPPISPLLCRFPRNTELSIWSPSSALSICTTSRADDAFT